MINKGGDDLKSIGNGSLFSGIKSKWLHLSGFIFFTLISQLPVWSVDYPPLSDYPNHLARMHVLMHAKNMGVLNNFYRIEWSILPNLAMDMTVPILGSFIGVELAGKMFIAATLFLISSGTLLLHLVLHRKPSIWPFISFLFLYNNLFLYGVLNFLFALGISLWAIAFWVWTSNRPFKPNILPSLRLVVLLFLTFFIFLCHLSAYVFFAFSVIAYELQANFSNKILFRNKCFLFNMLLALLLPLVVFLLISPTSDISAIEASNIPLGSYLIAMMVRKILAPLNLISNYDSWIDSLTFLALGVILIRSFFSGILNINRVFVPALIVLAIGFMLAPFSVFGSHMADTRVFIAFSFLLVACIEIKIDRHERIIIGIAVFLMSLFFLRTELIINKWLNENSLANSVVVAASKLPEGARHFVSFSKEIDYGSYSGSFKRQLPCLAIISRSAFVPSFYSMQGAQPVLLKPEFIKIKARSPGLLSPSYQEIKWSQILEDFDFLWVGPNEIFDDFPKDHLSLIENNTDFVVYKVSR